MQETEYEIDLRELFEIIKNRWLLIVSITCSAVIISVILSFFILKPQYEASTTMIVSYKQNQESVMTYNDLQTSQKLVATYTEIVKSERILEEVINKLNLELSSKELIDKITVAHAALD